MISKRQAMDDLPLAAYSTGVEPEEAVHDPGTPGGSERPATTMSMSGDADLPPRLETGGVPLDPLMAAERPNAFAARLPAMPAVPVWLANPREHLRDPRLLMTGVIGIGVVLLVLSLLGGGGGPSGPAVADASPSAPVTVVATPAPPGNASVELRAGLKGTYELAGATGFGLAADARVDATWSDPLGNTLAIEGLASAGTRTTAADLVLSWTVMVSGAPVTFTSRAGECTVGMAVSNKTLSGSFTCKKVRSDDGKHAAGARGTYRT